MANIHDEIDNWLAADLYGELSGEEQRQLHTHLVDCVACRKTHQETKTMNKILEETLTQQKPDPAFEQRMLAGFRNRVPERTGLLKLLVDLMRMRAVQVTAVAAVLLGLVQLGRMSTGETATPPAARDGYANEQLFEPPSQVAALSEPGRAGALDKSDELAAGKPKDLALAPPQSAVETRSELQRDFKTLPATVPPAKAAEAEMAAKETGSAGQAMGYATESIPAETPPSALANRKLIRNATVELEIVSFDDALQKITAIANDERGYVATTSSQKQANGKLRGEVVVKVLPENLDRFLQKIRKLGELKNQTLGTEDVTKAYFDTDARLKNARVMEQRLIDMLKTKTGKVSDLLQVEKELGRVREDIEKMQGELKYWDSQVQFATVTISLAEKDMEEPAAFLIKERAQLALYAPDVDKIYNDIKALASTRVQITNAQFNRDPDGRELANVWLRVPMKNYPSLMQSLNSLGKVENISVQSQDRTGTQVDEVNAPADVSIQIYSQGNIVSHESGPLATLRRTLAQSVGAIMWSLRMIGVAMAFLAPWAIALVAIVWIARRAIRARRKL